jgi:predicted nucleic acid-binding protein
MIRAVFDTKVIVSGFLSPTGPPGRIFEWFRSEAVQAVLDDRIAAEYLEVLLRPAFSLPPTEVTLVLEKIGSHAFRIETSPEAAAMDLPDPDDLPFLECAMAADVPLVTGNLRHFPKSIAGTTPILTPAQFVTLVGLETPIQPRLTEYPGIRGSERQLLGTLISGELRGTPDFTDSPPSIPPA